MVFDQIESLKQQYTDKYVVVDDSRPELARFRGLAGQIKTVNMSGRALVEFDAYNNIGWYDIELDFLKVVDKPPPKPVEEHAKPAKPAAAKAAPAKPKAEPVAGEKKLSPLEMARAQGAAKKPAETVKKSTSDVLAAARAGKAAAPTAKEAPAAKSEAKPAPPAGGEKKKLSTSEIIAAARAKAGAEPAAKTTEPPPAAEATPVEAGHKQTTAEILAAARRPAPTAESATVAPMEPPVSAAQEEPAAEALQPVATVEKPAKAASSGDKPKTTAEIIAWCRTHDAK
jgi:hypothetical protein